MHFWVRGAALFAEQGGIRFQFHEVKHSLLNEYIDSYEYNTAAFIIVYTDYCTVERARACVFLAIWRNFDWRGTY